LQYLAGAEATKVGPLTPKRVLEYDAEARGEGFDLKNYAHKGGRQMIHQTMSSSASQNSAYEGTIKIPNEAKWPFKTIAVSMAQARNNGIAQYAKFKNMTAAQMHKNIVQMGNAFNIEVRPVLSK
jgi:hypothetical protein